MATPYSYMEQVIRAVVNGVMALLGMALSEKACVIFDIDETALDNGPIALEPFDADKWWAHVQERDCKAIEPVLKLYKIAAELGIAVFFLSGRKADYIEDSIANLKAVGYTQWQGIYHVTAGMKTADFKKLVKQQIREMGYTIIMNVGDQPSDFVDDGPETVRVQLPSIYELVLK